MANYTVYADPRAVTGIIDLMKETVPVKSWFETYPNELCLYQQETEPLPLPAVISHVESNRITPLDKHIIGFVTAHTFVTTKQLRDCLTLWGIPHSEETVKNSVERLAKHQILRLNRFGIDEMHCSNYYACSLNKNGAEIAKSLNIPCSFTPFQCVMLPADVKRILARNQAWLSFLKSGLPLDFIRRGEIITAKEEKTAVVRPTIALSLNHEPMFLEIVRKGNFWEAVLLDKLTRYKALLDNYWDSNSWKLDSKPVLILNGENEAHNRRILEIASGIGLTDLFFTEDVRLCGSQFYHAFYQFTDNDERTFFCFDNPAAGTAAIA